MATYWRRKAWILCCLALCWVWGATAAWADQELIIDLRDEAGGTVPKAEGILRLPDGSARIGERLADGRFSFRVEGPKATLEFAGSDFPSTFFDLLLPADPVVERTLSLARADEGDQPAGVGGAPNDLCVDAIPVAIPSLTAGSTVDATIDPFPFCGTSITAPGVWYSVIGTGTTMTASTCPAGANYDDKISIYCGTCAAPVCVAGNDDACGLLSEISWCSQLGVEYLILVHGFAGATGNFDLEITQNAVACVPTVACGVVGACCFDDGSCEILTAEACGAADGDYQGDDTFCFDAGYAVDECGNAFEDISGTGNLAVVASTSDDNGDLVGIGFSFRFFGDDHATIGISSNGYLTFSPFLTAFTNAVIPSVGNPNDLIAPLWDDFNPGSAGDVHYQTLGIAPNRRFIAQWTAVRQFEIPDANTFQAILFEGSNCIEFRYGVITPQGTAGDYTVGVENQDGSEGTSIPGSAPSNGDCFSLCPGGVVCEMDVFFDIKPGSCPNPLNTKIRNGHAVLPVAILGTADFDVTDIDVSTLLLQGVPPIRSSLEDVSRPFDGEECGCTSAGPDGYVDLTLKFDYTSINETLGAVDNGDLVELTITGELEDGTPIEGDDCVLIRHGVKLLRPNGSEILEPGKRVRIEWETEIVDLVPDHVDIAVSVDDGNSYSIPVAMREADDGRANWVVSPIITSKAMAQVTVWDANGVGMVDESDDTFAIQGGTTGIPGGSGVPAEVGLERSVPDPFSGRTTVRFGLPRTTLVDLSVYSVEGRAIRRLASGSWTAGTWQIIWDGTDDSGKRVTPGAYFLRLSADGAEVVQRVTLVR